MLVGKCIKEDGLQEKKGGGDPQLAVYLKVWEILL